MDAVAEPLGWSLESAVRCDETGVFRVVVATRDTQIATDITVVWLGERGLAYLRFITVDRVFDADRATERAVEAWVAAHQDEVFSAALKVAL